MLALAITLLFTFAAILAVLTITDSVIRAREAYVQLMQQAALMQAGFAVQVNAPELRVRRDAVRVMPVRRPQARRMRPVPACAAA
ncbi:MAG: hypothetical protein CVT85_06255 [Alphaproteobacteria bacterium HGW-Alphaproteobacteria-7]|jgi:hypothetical protein|nr:MAG: hypothetical protein CVT85_06255 [Alphaproteobacteria bacterium HGW-Alphaproteobacteria-7]